MVHAAAGLAARGHQVLWLDGGLPAETFEGAPATLERIRHLHELAGGAAPRADLVLGGMRAPVKTAMAGWVAGARAMGLSSSADPKPWGWLGHWCWESLDAFAMIDSDQDVERAGAASQITAERLRQWSDEPIAEDRAPDHPDCEILERACEHWLAHRDGPPAAAAFIDRDGTLVVERGYLADREEVELLPGVPHALRELSAAGMRLVVVSNQSGVGRGFFPRRRVYEAMARLRELLRLHGVEIDAIYFCPHRPEHGCRCRKPGTELLEQAAANLNLALPKSVMIGDKLLDAATGQNARGRGILVQTGYGADEAARPAGGDFPNPPDYVARDLGDAVRWTLGQREGSGLNSSV